MKYISLVLILYAMGACTKIEDFEEAVPTLDVRVSSTTHLVGKEVVFNISGSAGLISVYTGQAGSVYESRNAEKPDRPVAIKGKSDIMIETFTTIYVQPGNYKVYFVAKNVNRYKSSEITKMVEIKVE